MYKKGWIVTFAGMALNLALGVLYTWSVFAKQLTETIDKGGFGWTKTHATLPYTVAIAVFAIMMVPAGRLQDKIGPRVVATLGALFCGGGMLISSFAAADNIMPVVIGFGLITGTGLGLGYASATPAAVKWFPPESKGRITGLVVAGFGLAPVYIAPLTKYFLGAYGITNSFRILGIFFICFAGLAAQLIKNPDDAHKKAQAVRAARSAKSPNDLTWQDMLKTGRFYLLYMQYVCAATAGLMIIGHLAKIVSMQSGGAIKVGFLFVALLAIFNASGRIIAGFASDYIGRGTTMIIVWLAQAVMMFFFMQLTTITAFTIGAIVVGFNYGACLSLMPSSAADYWGTKNLGLNYGILFTAWGVGGVFGPLLAGYIADTTGAYTTAYYVASGMMVFAALLAVMSNKRRTVPATLAPEEA